MAMRSKFGILKVETTRQNFWYYRGWVFFGRNTYYYLILGFVRGESCPNCKTQFANFMPLNLLLSVHGHWHSVSTLTVLTQCQYGPYSNIIFHEHYHSKRHLLKLERVHPNSNILERVHPYSNMTFKKGLFWNSNGLTPIHFAAIHGFLYILALKIDFCGHYFRW